MSNIPTGNSIKDLKIGMSESYAQTITDSDIKSFAGFSGDRNPMHLDEEFATNSRFKGRIAHGLLPASFFSAIFGTRIPGPGCVYVSQSLNFKRPIYINDTVKATVTITDIDQKRKRIFFSTICTVRGKIVIDGTAELFLP